MMYLFSLVASFLLLFSFVTGTLLVKWSSTKQLEKSFHAYMEATRNLQNRYVKSCFHSLTKTKKAPSEELSSKEKKTHQPRVPKKLKPLELRERSILHSRLNLYPLFKEGKKEQKELYEAFGRLLKILFPRFFLEKESEFLFIDALLSEWKKNPSPLEKLDLKELSDKRAYYQMLKMSLLDFVKIDPSKTTLYLPYASKEILSSLLDEASVKTILTLQTEKNSWTQRDLDIALEKPFPPTLWKICGFSKERKNPLEKPLFGKDSEKKILIKRLCVLPQEKDTEKGSEKTSPSPLQKKL